MTEPYRCVLADPPWKYSDKLMMQQLKRGAEAQYKTVMTTDEICELSHCTCQGISDRDPWPNHDHCVMDRPIADDALLAMWVTGPFLLNGDGARVVKAWGFEPKQLFTWVKGDLVEDAIVGQLGMGHVFRVDTEHLIVAKRGQPAVLRHDLRNYVFLAPKGAHSAKPSLHTVLETLTPGPYLELFARERVDGWDAVGDELPVDTRDRI